MSGSPIVELLHAQDAHRVRWRNGLGWTREIHAEAAADDEAWVWRASIADIVQTAMFSRFEGVERELVLLSGDGLTLRFDDGEVADLQPPHARLRFDGARALSAEPAGPGVCALNLMWRPAYVQGSVWHRPLVGTMVVSVDPGDCWFVHVMAGQAHLGQAGVLLEGDSIVLRSDLGSVCHVLDGGGSLLFARFVSPPGVAVPDPRA